jgi:hypothetical protein
VHAVIKVGEKAAVDDKVIIVGRIEADASTAVGELYVGEDDLSCLGAIYSANR